MRETTPSAKTINLHTPSNVVCTYKHFHLAQDKAVTHKLMAYRHVCCTHVHLLSAHSHIEPFTYWKKTLLPQLNSQGVFIGETMCFRCEHINILKTFWGIFLATLLDYNGSMCTRNRRQTAYKTICDQRKASSRRREENTFFQHRY